MIERFFVTIVPLLSLTMILNFEVPVLVGLPLMTPVEPASESPAGSLPEEMDQVYGVAPPEVAKVVL